MSAARGDRKPCTRTPCAGTMQFSREPLPLPASGVSVDGQRGWVCSESPGHFQAASGVTPGRETVAARDARWQDDGGSGHRASTGG